MIVHISTLYLFHFINPKIFLFLHINLINSLNFNVQGLIRTENSEVAKYKKNIIELLHEGYTYSSNVLFYL